MNLRFIINNECYNLLLKTKRKCWSNCPQLRHQLKQSLPLELKEDRLQPKLQEVEQRSVATLSTSTLLMPTSMETLSSTFQKLERYSAEKQVMYQATAITPTFQRHKPWLVAKELHPSKLSKDQTEPWLSSQSLCWNHPQSGKHTLTGSVLTQIQPSCWFEQANHEKTCL